MYKGIDSYIIDLLFPFHAGEPQVHYGKDDEEGDN